MTNSIKRNIYNNLQYISSIEIVGNNKIIIENCKKILECNEIMIKLKTPFFYITVWGTELFINNFNKENIIVNGKISSVEFENLKG